MLVRSRRLELPRPFGHQALNLARLPIPPRPHYVTLRGVTRRARAEYEIRIGLASVPGGGGMADQRRPCSISGSTGGHGRAGERDPRPWYSGAGLAPAAPSA